MASGEHRRAPSGVPDADSAIVESVRERGRMVIRFPAGWHFEYALYRVRRDGTSLILEPVTEAPKADAVCDRLEFDGGRWIVAGTLMPAAALLEMLGQGVSAEGIVELCPYLTLEDVRACLALAADLTGRPVDGSMARVRRGWDEPEDASDGR